MISVPNFSYQPGGSLPPESPTYVARQADEDLYQALLRQEFCYVLNSRQMGKSSLRIRTMERLKAVGIACAEIELSGIGSQQITAQQWYGGIIQELVSGFGLRIDRRSWLKERDDLSPVQRLSEFIELVLLQQIDQNIVIFVDEIDSVLSLSFSTDEFFALIRLCYEKRATKPEYRRLSFALLGVATPSDLIRDQRSAPFNIGTAIELRGFQLDESTALAQGLQSKASQPSDVLREVLSWTEGQPFLTQKLCWLIATEAPYILAGAETQEVERLVRSRILTHWEAQDEPEHLRTIRDRILRNSRSTHNVLQLYRKILTHDKIVAKNEPEYLELRLSGLVIKQHGNFRVFNRIYQSIFNLHWVTDKLEIQQPSATRLPWWKAITVSVVITALTMGARSLGIFQAWELQAFDQLMQQRPTEAPDSRLLLVTITEADVQSQPAEERGGASLSDRALGQLLAKLEQAKPSVIGLDVYRDRPVVQALPALANRMKQSDRFFAICQYGSPGVPPPVEVSGDRQGFNNVLKDTDDVVRRQLLAVSSPSPCQTKYSFNFKLASRYLQDRGILASASTQYLKLGTTELKTLKSTSGAYYTTNTSGHQLLINYRAITPIAHVVTLQDVLSPQFDLAWAKNRIVLIGTTASSFNDDDWYTPYSRQFGTAQTLTGIEVQAHMVSQLVSAVLDQRSLIWWLPEPMEILWVWAWAMMGAMVSRLALSISQASRGAMATTALKGGVMIVGLYAICWGLLALRGGWLPLVPTAIAATTSGCAVILLTHRRMVQDG